MLDFADVVAINKFERRGAEDALPRRRAASSSATARRSAAPRGHAGVRHHRGARFNDDGVTALYQHLRDLLAEHGLDRGRGHGCRTVDGARPRATARRSSRPARVRYLAEIAETVRGYHAATERAGGGGAPQRQRPARRARAALQRAGADAGGLVGAARGRRARRLPRRRPRQLLDAWPAVVEAYSGDEQVVTVRDRETRTPADPRVAVGHEHPPRRAAPLHRPRRAAAVPARGRTCRGSSPSPPGCSRSSATTRTRPGCSPARATPFRTNRALQAPVRGHSRRPGCRPRSTR